MAWMVAACVILSFDYFVYMCKHLPPPPTARTRTASSRLTTGSLSSCVRVSELTINGRSFWNIKFLRYTNLERPEHYDTQLQGRPV